MQSTTQLQEPNTQWWVTDEWRRVLSFRELVKISVGHGQCDHDLVVAVPDCCPNNSST